ncbi:lipopolysaccharide biosynthesis protein [Motiliproteus sp. MSK22-1]|uniref:lipopolysaccharide biosynthesis protein n=1 Tax=Motiliproteus sp. MSK22-1 TaxID=1897630 RepID=UPI00097634FC|nr:oligosaccharide flippase family protein [Motiliproteus sp. MSK22-1]OMH27013.1 hypothetical protein BGP75_00940 [Motiliproteus sp. MSK22-1]
MTRDFVVVGFSKILQILSVILTLRVLTSVLSPAEVGKVHFVLSTISFFALFFINPVGMYLKRRVVEWSKSDYLSTSFTIFFYYIIIVVLITSAILYILNGYWMNFSTISVDDLILIAALYLVFNTVSLTLASTLNLLGYRKSWAVITIIGIWVGIFSSWYFTRVDATATRWLYGQVSGFFIATCVGAYLINRFGFYSNFYFNDFRRSLNRASIGLAISFSFPISIAVILGWFQYQSWKVFVGQVINFEYLGLFAAGYAISAGIMAAFESTAQQFVHPYFYKNITHATRYEMQEAWTNYANLMLPSAFMTCSFIAALSTQLIHLLVDEKFWGVELFLLMGSFIEFFRIATNVYSLSYHASLNTVKIIFPQFVGALLVIVTYAIYYEYQNITILFSGLLLSGVGYFFIFYTQVNKEYKPNIKVIPLLVSGFSGFCFYFIAQEVNAVEPSIYGDISAVLISGVIYLSLLYVMFKRSFVNTISNGPSKY